MNNKETTLKQLIFDHFGKHPKQHGNTIKIHLKEMTNKDFKLISFFQSEYFSEVTIKSNSKGLTILLD